MHKENIIFCELEQLELRIDTCPVPCMYRTSTGSCGFNELTDEEVDAVALSKSRGKKVYKIKASGAAAKQLIEIGLAIDRYADYIRESVPKTENELREGSRARNGGEVVNEMDSSGVSSRLKRGFQLSDNQQEEFWSEERFSKWSKRTETSVTLRDMRHALISI